MVYWRLQNNEALQQYTRLVFGNNPRKINHILYPRQDNELAGDIFLLFPNRKPLRNRKNLVRLSGTPTLAPETDIL